MGNDTSEYKLYNGSFYTLAEYEGPCNPKGMGVSCEEPATCLPSLAPNDGVTSFNNAGQIRYDSAPMWDLASSDINMASPRHAGLAMLTVFQCITLEGWADVLYAVDQLKDALVSS